jgi:hypothetical protein
MARRGRLGTRRHGRGRGPNCGDCGRTEQRKKTSRTPILNRALIDPITNKAIGAKAPSDYFKKLRETIEEQELIEILRSQLIDADDAKDPMRRDDYEAFINLRLNDVVAAIESVTNCKVTGEGDA